jgi:hypothetical protein
VLLKLRLATDTRLITRPLTSTVVLSPMESLQLIEEPEVLEISSPESRVGPPARNTSSLPQARVDTDWPIRIVAAVRLSCKFAQLNAIEDVLLALTSANFP